MIAPTPIAPTHRLSISPADADEHSVGHRALQERERGHVHERGADAEQAEQEEGRHRLRPDAEERDRRAPDHHPQPEVAREPAAADERDRHERSEQAADADRRVEEADARLAEVEQVERHGDDEHAERTRDERLRGVEPDQQAQLRIGAYGPEAGERLAQHGAAGGSGLGSCADVDPRDEDRAEREQEAGRREQRIGAREREHDAAERRPGERPHRLEHR